MGFKVKFLWLTALLRVVVGELPGWSIEELAASHRPLEAIGNVVPGQYVIEFERNSLMARDVASATAVVYDQLRSNGYDLRVKEDYTGLSHRFSGAKIEILGKQGVSLEEIKSINGIANAWNVEIITLDHPEGPCIESPTNNQSEKFGLEWNPHEMTGVAELHNRGLTGKGQRVCFIDTGVDVNHPALAGRIVGGKNVFDPTAPDDISDCEGHGTFTSSVIVGKNKDFIGVAPEADIFMYKAFGCSGSTTNDVIAKAILEADADDCDIITCSFGTSTGYSQSLVSLTAEHVAEDRLVIAAVGNSGELGLFSAGSPAAGRGVVAVGSRNTMQTLGWPAVLRSSNGEAINITYVTYDGQKLNKSITAPVVFDPSDSCNPTKLGSRGEAVIIRRGICSIGKLYNFVTAMGFSYYVMYDSYDQGVSYFKDLENRNPAVKLFAVTDSSVGVWAAEENQSNHSLTFVVEEDADASTFDATGPDSGQVSTFTSWGPSFENDFIPSILAPGGDVYGAFPNNTFGISSGTSYSTPYIAGVAALFYSSIMKNPKEFIQRLSATASSLPSYDGTQLKVLGNGVASMAQQGSGFINAVKLFDYTTILVSEPRLALNDTDNRINSHTIRLRNTGDKTVSYKIQHLPADTIDSRDENWLPQIYYPEIIPDMYGSLDAPESVQIAAGEEKEVRVTLTAPLTNSSHYNGPIWSGKIAFQGDNNELITVPYMGIEVSTFNWTAFPTAPRVFRYDQGSGYLYPVDWESKPYKPDQLDSPEIYYSLRYGTQEISIDIVGEDYSTGTFVYPPVASSGSEGWLGSIRTTPDAWDSFANYPIDHPMRFDAVSFIKFQSFSNGTLIPTGRYRLLSRTLRMFGNEKNSADWDLYLSDPFWIQLGDDPIPSISTSTSTDSSSETSTILTRNPYATESYYVTSSERGESQTTPVSKTKVPCRRGRGSKTTSHIQMTSNPEVSISIPPISPTVSTKSIEASTTRAPETSETSQYETTSTKAITSTLSPATEPTGIPNVVTSVTLLGRRESLRTSIFDPDEVLDLSFEIRIPTRLPSGSRVTVAIPKELSGISTRTVVQDTSSNFIGMATFDAKTSLVTITFHKWVTWHSDMHGSFRFQCQLSLEFQDNIVPGTYVVEIATVGKLFSPSISYYAIDRRLGVYDHSRDTQFDGLEAFEFDIEVPGSMGPWTAIGISSNSIDEDGFFCGHLGVYIGQSFDSSNRITDAVNMTDNSIVECRLHQLNLYYGSAIEVSEVVRFRVAAIQALRSSPSISVPYRVGINRTTENGGVYLEDRIAIFVKPDGSKSSVYFSGQIDRDGPFLDPVEALDTDS